MDLAEKDKRLKKMRQELMNIKQLLHDKRTELKDNVEENNLLADIDIPYIRTEKEIEKERKKALNRLSEYIMDIVDKEELDDDLKEESKRQQREIMKLRGSAPARDGPTV